MFNFKRVSTLAIATIALLLPSLASATVIATYNTTNTTDLRTADWVVGATAPEMQYFVSFGQWASLTHGDPYSTTPVDADPGVQFGFMLSDDLSSYSAAAPSRVAKITGFTLGYGFAFVDRAGLKDVTLHYGFGQTMSITMPATAVAGNPWSQTVTLSTPIYSPYLYLTGESFYTTGPGFADFNPFINSFQVEGDWVDASHEVNLNATATMSATGVSYNAASQANDGNAQINNVTGSTVFARNAGQDTLTATFATEQTVGSIGLGLMLDLNGGREYPSEILLSYTGGSETISLVGPNLSYGRYQLDAPVKTTFLTITFPEGSGTAGWATTAASYHDYGITEFQAFETISYDVLPVPEPGSVALLTAGAGLLIGICFSRRRCEI